MVKIRFMTAKYKPVQCCNGQLIDNDVGEEEDVGRFDANPYVVLSYTIYYHGLPSI